VSWRSKKQPVVSRSTADAEYRATSQGLSEILWIRGLLLELKVLRQGPLNLWCDNKSTIFIANNPVQHGNQACRDRQVLHQGKIGCLYYQDNSC
jgi:hypothetical protein